ncbi:MULTISPECIES: dienelactone hydrolase family protein [unclassified Corynebacterium]|uniref:dienelactone hydrolase family protein n=1 Tax=unclassified Corynebacterium TaxID=2624378 RepID=UPI001EF596C2|nr:MULTISPECIES: dienelactone hydrolase family protein [unclassified Corynebacterium]MCG7234224.1 dienelactone hydrolase family protein [Corynebacterium sp. ACRPR]MCG7242947.1 dienelactone hydrolase family protein [Corynebacterium sp. ACRPS]MCG7272117.1 dienelactone hydrolase family protein [Corynebacterium sp. ACRQM]MDK8659356.1 dienelactone hydrolase family protein [Corynebacterium sp. MSK204]MDK8814835.1 dienelactone hydrolase family protein [Corynebacterium sp. MSK073]
MSANLKKHLGTLSKRGRNRVLVGDLDYAGITGKVYTPAEGQGLPAVAFGHDWMHKIKDYHATLRHLASWGIVVVAPNSETGMFPDHRNLSADMESALQIAAGVKLGTGNITVSPGKLGMVGHGMGGGTAVLGAVDNPKVKAVAAIYPAVTAPSAVEAARSLDTPGLVIGSGRDDIFNAGNPAKLAYNWRGQVAYRAIDKGTQAGFSEDRFRKLAIGSGAFQSGPTEIARGLVTGFLLSTLAGESAYDGFADPEASAKKVESFIGDDLAERAGVALDD